MTIFLFTFAGIWLDRHWGWKPWGTFVGAFMGIGAGLYNFIQGIRRFKRVIFPYRSWIVD